MEINSSELNLFIIWEKGRYKEKEILNDMNQKFRILNVYEVEWSDKYFSENLTRFYGQKLPKGSHKEKHCGRGKFILVVFLDDNPNYSGRETSRGEEIVNINTFDAKSLYREWTGGGHKIHGTNSIIETNHDLSLLLGMNASEYLSNEIKEWEGNISVLKKDLSGYNGWENITNLFKVLNDTTDYVVLRNFDCLPDQYNMENHGDIDLLVSNYNDIKYITNSREVFPFKKNRVHNKVKIAGEDVLFDFRYVGDNYYDESWEKSILSKRILSDKGFYVPDLENHFYSLLYHALVHKYNVSIDYIDKLLEIAYCSEIKDITKDTFDNTNKAKNVLDLFMRKNGYRYTEPHDLSVVFNENMVEINGFTFARKLLLKKAKLRRFVKKSLGLVR